MPTWWQFLVLALAAFRLTRLVGWDDLPPVARARAWLLGEREVFTHPDPEYRRPLLAELVHCPFCLGWWVSLAVYGAWLASSRWTLYAAVPLALSALVGLAAKNLDP